MSLWQRCLNHEKAFGIINLSLSPKCRVCLSGMDSDDPAEAWERLEARFNTGTPETEVVLLRKLIRLKCLEDGVLEHIKQFNELVGRLDRFGIVIPEKMLKVLLLEGLPRYQSFEHFWKIVFMQ